MTATDTHTEGSSAEISGAEIRLDNVTKRYPGQQAAAVDGLSLVIPAGEIVMFVGPSGCGKTTSLKMINRLIEPTSGSIHIGDNDISGQEADALRRHIGYVIQGGSLFPHMTVAKNIAIVPKMLGWEQDRIDKRVDELLELVNLDPAQLPRALPPQLSGGQQQRVGVARGLAADPPVILMDEPFGAVDPITRQRLQDELLSIQRELRKTIVCVTHDIDEAIKLGDRILILQEGAQVAQYDTPDVILGSPANDVRRRLRGRRVIAQAAQPRPHLRDRAAQPDHRDDRGVHGGGEGARGGQWRPGGGGARRPEPTDGLALAASDQGRDHPRG